MATNDKPHYNTDIPKFDYIYDLLSWTKDTACDTDAYRYFVGNKIQSSTYGQFFDRVNALANVLDEDGLLSSHVAMIGANSFPYLTVYLTMTAGDGVFVPVDKELPPDDLLHVLSDSDSEAVFCDGKYEELLVARRAEIPAVKKIINLDRETDDGDLLSFSSYIARGYALSDAGKCALKDRRRAPNTLALLVYTSGTTGNAKGVMLSEKNMLSCASYGLEISQIPGVGLSVLPYHHTYEIVASVLAAIFCRSTLCINDQLSHILKNLQIFKPDYMFVVPAFLELFYKKLWSTVRAQGKEFILKAALASSAALRKLGIDKRESLFKSVRDSFGGNLKKIGCGGAPLRPELGDFFCSIGMEIYNGYGITECSPLVSVNQEGSIDCSTVGVPVRCIDITFENPGSDGNGEICIKGDTVMLGYYKRPDLTAEVLTEDGVFHTGDYGRMNARGQLLVTGRKKNLIVLDNGKNVFPEEIENYLAAIPYVQDVIVFGIKDEQGQEVALGAECYLSDDKLKEMKIADTEAALKKDIARACKPLPSYKRVSRFYIRPIPFEKTTTNKVKRTSCMFAFETVKSTPMEV